MFRAILNGAVEDVQLPAGIEYDAVVGASGLVDRQSLDSEDVVPAASGILFQPNDPFSELNVLDSVISGFGTTGAGAGIRIAPRAGGDVDVAIENVATYNSLTGISSTAGAGSVIQALYRELLTSGGGIGVSSVGAGSTVRLADSTITNNTTGLSHPGSAKLISLGGNSVRGNNVNGTFTATEPQQ